MYGLGDIAHVFDRLCKVYGGVSMLNQQIDDFIWQGNKAIRIKYGSKQATAPIIIGDPSYFSEISGKIKKVRQIIRAFCIINHSILSIKPILDSAEIIIPKSEVWPTHDIYVCFTSFQQRVCQEGWYVAYVSTFVETSNPKEEIKPDLDILGSIAYKAVSICDFYEPFILGSQDDIYCTFSYDLTHHFKSTIEEALKLDEEIMGEPVNF